MIIKVTKDCKMKLFALKRCQLCEHFVIKSLSYKKKLLSYRTIYTSIIRYIDISFFFFFCKPGFHRTKIKDTNPLGSVFGQGPVF